jgi:pyocin large subunit-like protein
MLDGKPIWSDNREHTAMENLDYQFDHWGAGLGARDAQDYAKKARAFVDHPQHAVERVSRPNGDVLIYDKSANLFAIVRRDGAPRLFRKPPGGLADWEKAKSEASSSGRSRSRYRTTGGSDRGEGD